MAQTGEPWQGVESKLEALSLEDQEAVPQDSGAVPTSDMCVLRQTGFSRQMCLLHTAHHSVSL